MEKKERGAALIPLAVFVIVYLAVGIILDRMGTDMPFYQLSPVIPAFLGVIVAMIMFKGTLNEKMETFLKGCGHQDIMTMCFIYLFAGAFTAVSSAMGGVDAVVHLGLTFIPAQFIAAGVFVIAAFISISTGTSVGTVVQVVPIAVGLASAGGLNIPLVVGATVGGAMFGDNLSMISDTTIAATRSQGVEMKDKFRTNFKIAFPAAIVTIVLLLIFGRPDTAPAIEHYKLEIVKVLPYIFVLAAALIGINVFLVLTGGIVFSTIIGLCYGSFNLLEASQNIYNGFSGMFEIFLLSMIMGGLAAMIQKEGGINWLISKIRGVIKGRKSAELGIAAMASLTDIATANNTVSIIINGEIAKDISEEYGVDPKRTASLLDIFTCIFQGLILYGAQILMATNLAEQKCSSISVATHSWYLYILAICAIGSVFVAKDKKEA